MPYIISYPAVIHLKKSFQFFAAGAVHSEGNYFVPKEDEGDSEEAHQRVGLESCNRFFQSLLG